MISNEQPRLKAVPLSGVVFRDDLHLLIGSSRWYADKLLVPPKGEKGRWYREHPFPAPFYISPSGIRCWFVRDVEEWCRSIRMKATSLRMRRYGDFLDRPELMSALFDL